MFGGKKVLSSLAIGISGGVLGRYFRNYGKEETRLKMEIIINDPAASLGVLTGKIRSKHEASFGELNLHWGIKNNSLCGWF